MSSSKSMLLRVVLCILLVTVSSSELRRFCGPTLTKALQRCCHNRYASPLSINYEKRSGDSDDFSCVDDNSTFSYQSVPFLANFDSARDLRPRVRRDYWYLKRGVADECCRKPCTADVLKSYCY